MKRRTSWGRQSLRKHGSVGRRKAAHWPAGPVRLTFRLKAKARHG
jgi:hypothetical protein